MTEAEAAMFALTLLAKWGPVAAEKFLSLFKKGPALTVPEVDTFIAEVKVMDFWAISGLNKPAPAVEPVVPVVLP